MELLIRSTILLAIAAVAVSVVTHRRFPVRSPRWQCLLWWCVLVQGWILFGVSWEIPILPSTPPQPIETVYTEPSAVEYGDAPLPFPVRDVPDVQEANPVAIVTKIDAAPQTPREKVSFIPTVRQVFVTIWGLGIAVILLRWACLYGLFLRMTRQLRTSPDAWSGEWNDLLAEHDVRRKIPMLVSETLGPALVRRLFDYVLIVPGNVWKNLTPQGRRTVLKHELAHLIRKDIPKSLLATMLTLPHWFNPFAWLALRRITESNELLCDDFAHNHKETALAEYCDALITLQEQKNAQLVGGHAVAKHNVSQRITRLYHYATICKGDSTMKKILMIVTVLSLLFIGVVRIHLVAQQPKNEPQNEQAREPATMSPVTMSPVKGAKLEMELTGPDEVPPKSQTTYHLLVRNVGNEDAKNIKLELKQPGSDTKNCELPLLNAGDEKTVDIDVVAGSQEHITIGIQATCADNVSAKMSRRISVKHPNLVTTKPTVYDPSAKDADSQGMVQFPPKEQLVYDGKSFAEWLRLSQTELNKERHIEIVKAFAAFGRKGYGTEATKAILDLLDNYPNIDLSVRQNRERTTNDSIQKAVDDAFRSAIPLRDSLPLIFDAYQQQKGNLKEQMFFLLSLCLYRTDQELDKELLQPLVPVFIEKLRDPILNDYQGIWVSRKHHFNCSVIMKYLDTFKAEVEKTAFEKGPLGNRRFAMDVLVIDRFDQVGNHNSKTYLPKWIDLLIGDDKAEQDFAGQMIRSYGLEQVQDTRSTGMSADYEKQWTEPGQSLYDNAAIFRQVLQGLMFLDETGEQTAKFLKAAVKRLGEPQLRGYVIYGNPDTDLFSIRRRDFRQQSFIVTNPSLLLYYFYSKQNDEWDKETWVGRRGQSVEPTERAKNLRKHLADSPEVLKIIDDLYATMK